MTNLEYLYACNNKLTTFTLTDKSNLTYVRLSGNTSLTTADISNNSTLGTLYISACTALTKLNCYSNNLTRFDVTGNTALKELECYVNANLATITGLASCTAITYLECEYCALTDLSACNSMTNLVKLFAGYNKLTNFTLKNKSKLTVVDLAENAPLTWATIAGNSALTSLDVRSCPALKTLYCYSNKLSSLCYDDCPAITTLDCSYNQLASLKVYSLTKLVSLYCFGNPSLTSIVGLDKCASTLIYLDASNCNLSNLDLSSLSKLQQLYCRNNRLTSLNVQGKTALTTLYCSGNQLTSLYVQGCTALNAITCYNNKFTDAGMTTLVNSLPTRTTSNPGELYVLDNPNENNVFTDTHRAVAAAKNWTPYRYTGSSWEEIPGAGPATDGFLSLPRVTAVAGSTVTIPIDMSDVYGMDYSSFQVCFCFPEEFEILDCAKGELVDPSTSTQLLNNTRVVDGRKQCMIIVLNYTTGNSEPVILGDEGTILYVTVKISEGASGEYEIGLEQNQFVCVGGDHVEPSDVTSTITVSAAQLGDVNGDGDINVADVTMLIGNVLSGTSADASVADVNGDGDINVADVTMLIQRVLSGTW